MIGPYRVIRSLGEGGMGVVYEAMNDAIKRRGADARAGWTDGTDLPCSLPSQNDAQPRCSPPAIASSWDSHLI